ncbi:hypothetical protein GO755_25840 [Spirosoma sp. HMF4905]|uniref:Uncharacterized protein n=1 Tax=Spirosoma arboris TaxID=2682092 RepID=A0A7K1SI91_9BACT|nr:hypothetical protein [Spirosoma arboris]MVM33485.1 hypothetical protein [Spirosoma arboris]
MKISPLVVTASLLFTLALVVHTAQAQTPKESLLITHLVKGANQPGAHSEGDVFLMVKIGKIEYIAELESGKVVSQHNADVVGGGLCGNYAEVSVNLLNKAQQETAQGAGQVLKFSNGKWKMIALSEGDYACDKLKGISQAVITCLKVECN